MPVPVVRACRAAPDPATAERLLAAAEADLAAGFTPLEELVDLWPGNPCLLLVKALPGR